MTPSPAIVGPATSPSTGGGEAKESVPPKPTKEVALSVPKSEVKPNVIVTAETQAKQVEIQQKTFNTLVNTITFNVQRFNEIPIADRPDFLKNFVEMFQKENPDLKDLTDQKVVAEKAEVFLKKGGGNALLATFKLLETEAALLYGGGKVRIVEKKAPKNGSKDERPKIIYLGKDGMTTEEKQPGFWENLFKKNSEAKTGKYDLEVSTTFETGGASNITDLKDIAYLNKCGWSNGLDIKTAENRGILIERVLSIAQAREELFRETGLKPEDISQRLNFLDAGHHFIAAGRSAYLTGETGGGYTPAEFATEGKKITDEISQKTKDKLAELRKKNKSEQRGKQLTKRIEQLGEEKNMDPDQIKAEQALIEQQIVDKKKEAGLFDSKKLLPGQKAETARLKDEKSQALDKRAVEIGVPRATLEDWSADSSNPESWRAIKNQHDILVIELQPMNNEKTKLETDLTKWLEREPKSPAVTVTETEKKTGNTVVTTPEKGVTDAWERWNKTVDKIQTRIAELEKKLNTDPWTGTGASGNKTAETILTELELDYTRRQQVVENKDEPETKKAIDNYREADAVDKQKGQDIIDVDNKITGLRKIDPLTGVLETEIVQENRIRKEIKDMEEAKKNVGGADIDDQREIDSLQLVADLYNKQEVHDAMEQRLVFQQGGSPPDLEFSPEFRDYPPAVLQAINLMFGPEALSSTAGNPDLFKKAKSLLESQWFVRIIIDQIENQNLVPPGGKVPFGVARISGEKNVKLDMAGLKARTGATNIELLTIADVNRTCIENIMEEISKSALGYI